MTSTACPAETRLYLYGITELHQRCPSRARRGGARSKPSAKAGSRPLSAAGEPPRSARSGRTWRPIIDCSATWRCEPGAARGLRHDRGQRRGPAGHPPPQSRGLRRPPGPPPREGGDGAEGLLGSAQRLRVLRGHPPGAGVDAQSALPVRAGFHVGRKGRAGAALRGLAPAGPPTAHAPRNGGACLRVPARYGASIPAKSG